MKIHILPAHCRLCAFSGSMFLHSQVRKKDGKEHASWSVIENKRLHDGLWSSVKCSTLATQWLAAINHGPARNHCCFS